MTTLVAVHGALPPHRYPQDEITDAFARVCLGEGGNVELMRRIHANTQVKFRHLAVPLERYQQIRDFTEANGLFLEIAQELALQALAGALDRAGLPASAVDVVFFTTVTGVAAPSIDARIAGRAGLRPDVKRVPLFGLGCVAGAAGIARMHDYLLGHPGQVAALISVELCSLTLQRSDRSVPNLVAAGLFGDGATAVIAVGSGHPSSGSGPQVLDSRSHLYPDTERTMGWDVGAHGLSIVLDAHVPDLVRRYLSADVAAFLDHHRLSVSEVGAWVCHPGGPKVIEAIEESLALPPAALALTWESLAEVGNLSSSSVLHVLRDTLDRRPPESGTPGVLMAMGPGFCSELVLLQW